ncbi:MAG: hypothetical protein WB699_12280 [Bacteroidota bacterium]
MPGIHIDLAAALGIVAFLTILAILAAAFFYRKTHPPVSPARRRILMALRALVFAFLVLLLFDPILHLSFTTSTPPVLAVLFDNSKSMRIIDRSGNRRVQIENVRTAGVFDRVMSKASVLYYTFGIHLRPYDRTPKDTLSLNEGGTDIASALQSISAEKDRRRINAVLLVSDGTYTIGRDPLGETERLGVPLYCVGIGDTAEQKDVLVSRVAANDLVYAGTRAPVRATVLSSGFDSAGVEVTLREGGKVLDRSKLQLQPGSREYNIDLSYVPDGVGLNRYTVDVSSLPGEITAANNHRSFVARVLKSKLKILIIGGEPSPDLTIVRQTLEEDKNLQVRSVTQTSQGTFYEGRPPLAFLDSADCFIFVGFPTSSTSPEIARQLSQRIAGSFTPILYVDGRHASPSSFRDIAGALPFTVGMRTQTERSISFQPADDQREHPILGGGADWSAWNNLPPVFSTVSSYTAKPGSVVLGFARSGKAASHDPVLLAQSVSQEKSVALLAYGIWRWRLMTQESAGTADLFATFLTNTIKWLTTPDDRRPVRVSPVEDSFPDGQPATFTGQIYNQNAEPVENATLHVTAERDGLRFETDMRPIGGGRYEGSLDGLTEGDYTFHATGSVNGAVLGEDRGRFVVGGTELEFQDTRANHLLLRQLAYRTGGAYLEPGEIDRLDSLLFSHPAFVQQPIAHTTDSSLRQAMWMIIAIVLLLATEWILRRLSGML